MTSLAPQENQVLPAFSLPAVWRENEAFVERALSNVDFAGKPLVLFFYPKDATCGCTVEVCGFRDLHSQFQSLGVSIAGCSRDTIGAHKRFIQSQSLPFPLLSDKDRAVARQWNLLVHKTMYGKPVTGTSRDTFLVDADGKVRRIMKKITPLGHAQEVLQAARDLF